MYAIHLFAGLLLSAPIPQRVDWHRDLPGALSISVQDLEKVEQGEAVGRILKASTPKGIGILGIVRLPVTGEQYWNWYRHVDNFRKSEMVTAVSEIQVPAKLENFSDLQLPESDLNRLRSCKPHDCGIKASGAEIEAASQLPEDQNAAANLVRRWLYETVRGYQENGNRALPVYEDKDDSVNVAKSFEGVMESTSALFELFPALRSRLEQPQSQKARADEVYFWSLEHYGFGLKPVLNLMHVVRQRPDSKVTVICAKQLRATHYYEASLGISVLLDRADGGSTLIYVNRSRIDTLHDLSGIKRRIAEFSAPRAIRKQLETIRRAVEQRSETQTGE